MQFHGCFPQQTCSTGLAIPRHLPQEHQSGDGCDGGDGCGGGDGGDDDDDDDDGE